MGIIERAGAFISPVIKIETIKTSEQIADERHALATELERRRYALADDVYKLNLFELQRTQWHSRFLEACQRIPVLTIPNTLHPLREVVLFGKKRLPFNLIENPPLPKFEHLKDLPQAS